MGRGGEVCRGHARVDSTHRRGAQQAHPDRFLFAPTQWRERPHAGFAVRHVDADLASAHARDEPQGSHRKYERLFDEARRRVRAWEKANVKERTR